MTDNGKPEKTIAYVVYPGISSLELVGTYAIGRSFMMSRQAKVRLTTVAERVEPLATDTPLGMLPGKSFAEVPHPDMLFVMGGGLATLFALGNEPLVDYVRSAAETAELVIGISSGTLLLAAAGLLEGRSATTHWAFGGILERLGVRYMQKRWVEDGKYITTAGGTGGLDMGIELVAQRVGKNIASLQQLMAEYDPQPLYGNIDWGAVDRNALAPILVEKRAELHQALAGRPHLLAAVEGWLNQAAPQRRLAEPLEEVGEQEHE